MYNSPITFIDEFACNFVKALEDKIIMEVQSVVNVDRDELIKALEYDRRQYEKGYADGVESIKMYTPDIVFCKDCFYSRCAYEGAQRYCRTPFGEHIAVEDMDFCSRGERE